MTDYKFETIEGNVVSFSGKLVAHADQEIEFSDNYSRQFDLDLYATDAGGFVPVITYLSTEPSEKSGKIVETVDLATDVESCFFVFEPEELLVDSQKLTRDQLAVRRQLSARLQSVYETLANSMLDQLARHLQATVGDKAT